MHIQVHALPTNVLFYLAFSLPYAHILLAAPFSLFNLVSSFHVFGELFPSFSKRWKGRDGSTRECVMTTQKEECNANRGLHELSSGGLSVCLTGRTPFCSNRKMVDLFSWYLFLFFSPFFGFVMLWVFPYFHLFSLSRSYVCMRRSLSMCAHLQARAFSTVLIPLVIFEIVLSYCEQSKKRTRPTFCEEYRQSNIIGS